MSSKRRETKLPFDLSRGEDPVAMKHAVIVLYGGISERSRGLIVNVNNKKMFVRFRPFR